MLLRPPNSFICQEELMSIRKKSPKLSHLIGNVCHPLASTSNKRVRYRRQPSWGLLQTGTWMSGLATACTALSGCPRGPREPLLFSTQLTERRSHGRPFSSNAQSSLILSTATKISFAENSWVAIHRKGKAVTPLILPLQNEVKRWPFTGVLRTYRRLGTTESGTPRKEELELGERMRSRTK